MARIVKTKKRRVIRLEAIATLLFTTAIIFTIMANLFLRNINTSLMINIQKMNNESASLRTENQNLTVTIQTLRNKDRIFKAAEEAGLSRNNNNIVSLGSE